MTAIRWWILGIGAFGAVACGNSHVAEMDGGGETDAASSDDAGGRDSGPGRDAEPGEDAGVGVDAGVDAAVDAGFDAAPSGDPCETPGVIETFACGFCGSAARVCTAAMIWEAGPCEEPAGAECEPGTTRTRSCGRCGTEMQRCDDACRYLAASCEDETGACTPGSRRRETTGCGSGEFRERICSDLCELEPAGMCMPAVEEVDIMILVDVTGSHTALVRSNAEALANELAEALLLDADVRVGVAIFADFPVSPHGSPGDVPFEGLLAPTGDAAMTERTIEMLPSMYGGDGPESGIEALSILAGGPVHPDAEPFTCPAGTEAGSCFRPGSWRAVVILTDITQHNAPHPALPPGTLVEPYTAVAPAPATWAEARTRMDSSGLALFAIVPSSGGFGVSEWSPAPQLELLADELGQDPATSVVTYAPGTTDLGPAIRTTANRLRDYFLLTLP